MPTFQTEVTKILLERRKKFEALSQNIPSSVRATMSEEETREARTGQMMHGFLLAVIESVEGKSTVAIENQIEIVLPSLRDNGLSLEQIVLGAGHLLVQLTAEVIPEVSVPNRAAATAWIAGFTGDFLVRIIGVWRSNG